MLKGLKKFSDCEKCQHGEKGAILGFIEKVECSRAKLYDDIMAKLEYLPMSMTRSDFEKYHEKFKLRVETNTKSKLEDLTDELIPGNQLWMLRKSRIHHKSYAHVAIVSEDKKYIHIAAPSILLMLKSKAVVQEESLSSIGGLQRCFVVRLPEREFADLYLKRAKVCLGIQFDYDASSANCETFCHFVHGNWDGGNVQTPRGGGQQLVGVYTKCSKLFKSLDDPLINQMKSRIGEASLILPNETF